jgi:dUTP pyrophosphatase
MATLHIKKLADSAHLPERANDDDLGYDLFCCEDVAIPAGGMAKVRTGIAVAFPEGWGGIIKDRSSMAAKRITTSAGVIDHGYRGEIMILLSNHSEADYQIEADHKIAQLIPVPVVNWRIEEVTDLSDTDRGEEGFGSTGHAKNADRC